MLEAAISTELVVANSEAASDEIAPIEEEINLSDSRYAPLAIWLRQQSLNLNLNNISLTFGQVEEIIGEPLPASARKHRAWWSNHLEFNPQARQWWDAGWRVSTVRMIEEIVVFARVEERKKAYIDFFSSLLGQLAKHHAFPMKPISPDGQSWLTIAGLPTGGKKVASIRLLLCSLKTLSRGIVYRHWQ